MKNIPYVATWELARITSVKMQGFVDKETPHELLWWTQNSPYGSGSKPTWLEYQIWEFKMVVNKLLGDSCMVTSCKLAEQRSS